MKRLIHVRWDIFHRAVNDCKLSMKDTGQCFVSAQMHSTYLWALGYRPFGSGAFMEEKRRSIEHFFATENHQYPPFQQQWHLFRADLNLSADASPEDVWNHIATLPGFQCKGTLPKLSRWFSWNQSCEEQVGEFRVFRMILQHWLGKRACEKLDPNEAQHQRELQAAARASAQGSMTKKSLREEFSKLKANLGGGMKLAFHLMSDRLLQMVRLIALATRPTWTWYAKNVQEVKNATHTLEQTIFLQNHWCCETHLQETARLLVSNHEEVVFILSDPELKQFSDTQKKLHALVVNILKRRTWSLAKQYCCPPDCYASIMSGNAAVAEDKFDLSHQFVQFI